jgi:hypothetical protein
MKGTNYIADKLNKNPVKQEVIVKGLKIYARSHVFSYLGRRAEKLELQ